MDSRVYIEIPPSEVNYVNRILEGYEYLGVLTTINPKRAICMIWSTEDTREEVIFLLSKLKNIPIRFLSGWEEAEGVGTKK